MKLLSILLACLLTLSLTACSSTTNSQNNNKPNTQNSGNTQNGTNANNTTPDVLPGKDDTVPETENPIEKPDMMPDDSADNNVDSTLPEQNPNTDRPEENAGQDVPAERRLIYNGNHYVVTDETLTEDTVGIELFSIMNIVTDMPAKEGDAMGLDEGTRVFRLKDDNEYDEIAVEISGIYYKAVQKAQ